MEIKKRGCFIMLVVITCTLCLCVSSASGEVGVGDNIIIGSYKSTPIEWQVLELDGDNALVISSKILCSLPYNTVSSKFLNWENCSLRTWLNNDFISTAFNDDQMAIIQLTHVDNSSAQHRDTYGTIESQPDTDDKVFLLSWKEVCEYFPTDESRICQKTSWWTRSCGENPGSALAVGRNGYMGYGNESPENEDGIRPAMWISLNNTGAYSLKGEDTGEPPEYVDQSEDFEYRVNGNQATITKYIGQGGTVFIPPTLGGKQVKTIPRRLFGDIRSINCVVIPEGVTKIEDSVFWSCDLEEVYIPASVTSIGNNVFANNDNLEAIHVDPDNKKYTVVDGVLFNKSMDTLIIYPSGKTDADYTVPDGVKTIGGGAFSESSLETITLPEGVTSIGDIAFWPCLELKTLYIPSTLSKISDSAFGSYNYKMENFVVSENNKWFTSQDGVLYNKKMDTLIMYPNNKDSKTFVMPDTVKKVSREAFGNTYNLEEITISKNLTKIDDYLFYVCRDLRKVVLHDKVTAIGDAAFGYAENMHIYIPASVKRISDEAFFECKNITIEGKKGSYAEQYANKFGITFVESD